VVAAAVEDRERGRIVSDDDPRVVYEALRAETAQMLGLDLTDLSAVAGLKLDLVSLLRLSLDELHGRALSGAPIDMATLNQCVALLQKLLPSATTEVSPPEPNFDDAAEQFARLIEHRADALEARQNHLAQQEIERLNALLVEKNNVIERLSAASPPPPTPTPTPQLSVIEGGRPKTTTELFYERGGYGHGSYAPGSGPKEW
jgi:hypothetical protein